MPPKDPELIALRKELEDLIAKCQVIHFYLFHCIYIFCYLHKLFLYYMYLYYLENKHMIVYIILINNINTY